MKNRTLIGDFYYSWMRGTALYVKWAGEHGISYIELTVLYALMTNGPATQKNISEYYGLTKQTVNHCIRHMEGKGYIRLEKSREDGREKKVLLTDAGEEFARNMLAPLFHIEDYICRNISSDKLTQAIETRELFNTLFEKAMEKEE